MAPLFYYTPVMKVPFVIKKPNQDLAKSTRDLPEVSVNPQPEHKLVPMVLKLHSKKLLSF